MADKQVICTNSNIAGVTHAGYELCRRCWNGDHAGCLHGDCECLCLAAIDPKAARKRVKPETLPLPDVGYIDVK